MEETYRHTQQEFSKLLLAEGRNGKSSAEEISDIFTRKGGEKEKPTDRELHEKLSEMQKDLINLSNRILYKKIVLTQKAKGVWKKKGRNYGKCGAIRELIKIVGPHVESGWALYEDINLLSQKQRKIIKNYYKGNIRFMKQEDQKRKNGKNKGYQIPVIKTMKRQKETRKKGGLNPNEVKTKNITKKAEERTLSMTVEEFTNEYEIRKNYETEEEYKRYLYKKKGTKKWVYDKPYKYEQNKDKYNTIDFIKASQYIANAINKIENYTPENIMEYADERKTAESYLEKISAYYIYNSIETDRGEEKEENGITKRQRLEDIIQGMKLIENIYDSHQRINKEINKKEISLNDEEVINFMNKITDELIDIDNSLNSIYTYYINTNNTDKKKSTNQILRRLTIRILCKKARHPKLQKDKISSKKDEYDEDYKPTTPNIIYKYTPGSGVLIQVKKDVNDWKLKDKTKNDTYTITKSLEFDQAYKETLCFNAVLTAKHVIENCDDIELYREGETNIEQIRTNHIWLSPTHDLGIAKTHHNNCIPVTLQDRTKAQSMINTSTKKVILYTNTIQEDAISNSYNTDPKKTQIYQTGYTNLNYIDYTEKAKHQFNQIYGSKVTTNDNSHILTMSAMSKGGNSGGPLTLITKNKKYTIFNIIGITSHYQPPWFTRTNFTNTEALPQAITFTKITDQENERKLEKEQKDHL